MIELFILLALFKVVELWYWFDKGGCVGGIGFDFHGQTQFLHRQPHLQQIIIIAIITATPAAIIPIIAPVDIELDDLLFLFILISSFIWLLSYG